MTTLAREMVENVNENIEEKREEAANKHANFSKEFNRDSALKAGLELLNAAVTALEATAWQGRELVEEVKERAQGFDQDKDDFIKEVSSIAGKAKLIPIRLKRMAKTAITLSLIVGSYRLWGTRSAFIPTDKQAVALERLHTKNAQRFRKASLEHGGAFLKVGQLISARSVCDASSMGKGITGIARSSFASPLPCYKRNY